MSVLIPPLVRHRLVRGHRLLAAGIRGQVAGNGRFDVNGLHLPRLARQNGSVEWVLRLCDFLANVEWWHWRGKLQIQPWALSPVAIHGLIGQGVEPHRREPRRDRGLFGNHAPNGHARQVKRIVRDYSARGGGYLIPRGHRIATERAPVWSAEASDSVCHP